MQKVFTKEYMQSNCGCYSEEKLMCCSFMKNEEITIESIINSEIPLKDKYWFICKKAGLTKRNNQEIAIRIAELVLFVYEIKYPENKAPREAIHAAKEYINGHITLDELLNKRRNVADAAAAAYAADAAAYADADAAAYAADAAAAAAAYAAAYAAYAAAYADADAAKQQLQDYLLEIIKTY